MRCIHFDTFFFHSAFLTHHDFNVIVVDWSSGSFSLYDESAWQVYTVGDKIAEMIRRLDEARYLKVNETVLVGHSLGAHVMGSAGYNLGGRVRAIFGNFLIQTKSIKLKIFFSFSTQFFVFLIIQDSIPRYRCSSSLPLDRDLPNTMHNTLR